MVPRCPIVIALPGVHSPPLLTPSPSPLASAPPAQAARTKIFFYGKLYSGIGTLMGATAPEVIRQIISSGYDDGSGSGDGAGLASDGTSSQSWSQYLFGFEPEGLVTIKVFFFLDVLLLWWSRVFCLSLFLGPELAWWRDVVVDAEVCVCLCVCFA